MIIEKYIFCMPKAIKWASSKVDVTPPSPTSLQVLYCIRRLATPTNATIIDYLRRMQNPANDNIISVILKNLTSQGLIYKDSKTYALTPLGREFLGHIRRYLVNVRL